MAKKREKKQKHGGGGGGGATRSAATVRRLKMYNCRAKRDRKGKIKKSQEYQSKDLRCTRIRPDRRYFMNTRVIWQKDLQKFREDMQNHTSRRNCNFCNNNGKMRRTKGMMKSSSLEDAMRAISDVVSSQQLEDVPVKSDFYGKN